MNRSCPFWAWASAAARALMVVKLMLSTTTVVLFFCPHSTVYFLLNHSSHAGTKWLHWQIFNVFCWAAARSGNRNAGPSAPAARLPAPAILMKSLRDTSVPFFLLLIKASSVQVHNLFPSNDLSFQICHSEGVSPRNLPFLDAANSRFLSRFAGSD